jgi:DNA-binding SARP family transcriptional activator
VNLLILGTLEVRVEGVPVPLGGAKPRAMLAALLLHPNEVVSVGRLTNALWGDQPPPSAAANIKTYASQLRKVLDGGLDSSRLLTRSPGYLFRVEPGELDLLEFETRAANGRAALARGDFELAARQLGEALSLWRGDVCADITLGAELDVARSRMDEHRMAVTEDCLEARLHRGEGRELVPELRELVAVDPLRERLWEYLMLALSSAGRQADALAAYTDCRAAFVRELGLEPSPQLRDLQAAILANDVRGPDRQNSPLPTGASRRDWQDLAPLGPRRAVQPPQHPPPQRHSPLRSWLWRTWHSLWILPALMGMGIFTWISFLYIGMRARRRNWLLFAVGYAALLATGWILSDITHPHWVSTLGLSSILAGWGGGTVHALFVNRSWLRWRSSRTPWYRT